MTTREYDSLDSQPLVRKCTGAVVSRFPLTLVLLLVVTTSLTAEPLPWFKSPPASCDDTDFVLSWDHSPGWYWPTLDSLGVSRWWVEFEAPAELDVLDCRIASYGGSGEGVTIELLRYGQILSQIDTTLLGYLENGYEIIPFPEPVPIPADSQFTIKVTYAAYYGPPFMTADNDGGGADHSFFQNGSTPVVRLLERDLCLRAGVQFEGSDPLAPFIQLGQLPLVWEGEGSTVLFHSRVTDNSPLADVALTVLQDGSSQALYEYNSPLQPLLELDLSGYEFVTGSDYRLALTAADLFGNSSRDTTRLFTLPPQWTEVEQVTSGARFLDFVTAPDPVNSAGSALAVRLVSENSNLIAFQPQTARLLLRGEQPFTLCLTPEYNGQPAPDLAGSYPGDLDWSYRSFIDPGPSDSLKPRWLEITFDSTGNGDTLFSPHTPFWIVLLYEENTVPSDSQNSFGCDTSVIAGSSWRFNSSTWQFEEIESGNILLEVRGTGASCDNLFNDSLLQEDFEAGQLPLCWSNNPNDTLSVGWEFGTTSTTYFSPDYRSGYAFNNSDRYPDHVIQDTLLTPILPLEQNAVLKLLSWLRLDDLADLSSAAVIWRQEGDPFQQLLDVTQEATTNWSLDSIEFYPREWREEALQLTNPAGSRLQFGFVYAADNPGIGCYGWAVDSISVTDTTGFTLFRWQGEWVMSFEVSPAFPNPFNQTTSIAYRLLEPDRVTARVYDALGREVRLLLNDEPVSGEQLLVFDAGGLASGIYFLQLHARNSGRTVVRKTLYLK
ncbi:MAG: T9SS type A sorting domain-containing protein [Candidatus Delongbacteria bacterium]|nr:T9SS type A sorting domain-containing protein [Candidatus Delongbacteria bacterium]